LQNHNENPKLLHNRYFTLVTRLLIDKDGNLQQGNLVDLDEKVVGQFRQVDELPDLVRAWIKTCVNKPGLPPNANNAIDE
jgi:hypothetical protein